MQLVDNINLICYNNHKALILYRVTKEFMMNHITELDNLTKATRRREFDDGLMDFVFGAVFEK